jgi:hypothetical protein
LAIAAKSRVATGRLSGEQAPVSLFPFMPGYPQDPRDLNLQPDAVQTAIGRPAGRSARLAASRSPRKRHAWRSARTRCPGT